MVPSKSELNEVAWEWWRAGIERPWSRLSGKRQGHVRRGMERSKERLLFEKSTGDTAAVWD